MPKPLVLIFFAAAFYFFTETRLPAVHKPALSTEGIVHASAEFTKARLDEDETENVTVLTRSNFRPFVASLYQEMGLSELGLDADVFEKAMTGYYSLEGEGTLRKGNLLTIIDFGKASTEKRFYTIDLEDRRVLYHTYVAHGRNTGDNLASEFSNVAHSNQSSLGFYVTAETYYGSKGYSLRLDGLEESFNDKIRSRAIVVHGAHYVTESWIKRYGRLGRSQGCPALPPDLNKEIIDAIKGGTVMFAYYPEPHYLNASRYLDIDRLFDRLDEKPLPVAGVFPSL